jgi:hypothetical protein
MKFVAELLALQPKGAVAVTEFANYVLETSTAAPACHDGQNYKKPLLGWKCKNCGKSKDQHEQR